MSEGLDSTRLLLANSTLGFVANIAVATVAVIVHWSVVSPALLLSWWTALALLTGWRALVVAQFRRKDDGTISAAPWYRKHTLGTLLSGITWGTGSLLLFTPDSIEHQAFLCLALAGMVVGAVPIHSASRFAFIAFAYPACVPIILRVLWMGDSVHAAFGGIGIIFLGMMTGLVWTLHDTIVGSFELTAKYRRTEHQLRDLFDNTSDLIQSVALDGRLLFVNRAWRETLGYTDDEAARMNIFDILHPATHEHCRLLMQRLSLGEQVGLIEIDLVTKDGRTLVAEGQVSLRVELGQPVATRGIFRDISARKAAERDLRTSEERYRLLVDSATDLICQTDATGRLTFVNPTAIRTLQYTEQELLGTHFSQFIREDVRPQAKRFYLRQFARRRQTTYYEYPANRKDGSELWLGQNVNALVENGVVTGFQIVARDITARTRAEDALRKSEERWTYAFEGSGDGVWDWNVQTNRVFYSSRWKAMLGYADDEIGETFAEWESRIHPDDKATVSAELENHLKGRSAIYSSEHRSRCKDGSYRWMLDRGKVCSRDTSGAPLRVVGTYTDITERRSIESALRESEAQIRAIIETALDAVVAMDEEGVITRWNNRAESMFGWSREEAIGRTVADTIIPPSHRASHWKGLRHFLNTPERQGLNLRMDTVAMRKDGAEFPVELAVAALKTDERYAFTAFITDISERKDAEERLRRSEAFVSSVLENLPSMVFVKDAKDLRFARLNRAGEELLGRTRTELIGKNDYDFFPKSQADFFTAKDRLVLDSHRHLDISEEKIETKNRGLRTLHTKKVPLYDATGAPQFLLGISEDITEQRRAEEAVQRSNHELEQFAYVVSHDLKAPLRAINSLANWLVADYKEALGPEGQEQLCLLQSRVQRMNSFIDGILAYSRVTRTQERPLPVDLNVTVRESIELLAPPPHILIDVPSPLPTVVGEPTRLAQVFQNLLSNAIKYMDKPQGKITVTSSRQDQWWQLAIADNGPGIEARYFEKIFQLFQTLSLRDEREGTGIGLSLVKKIVESYGGKVWVESEIGHGTTFYFTLPADTRIPIEGNGAASPRE